ncbi:MAG TPA: thioredoxin family protein [Burkholderiaceae bacterium]|nr:thioredoxin family protein [Burkholderiaceae bacterium]
MKPLIPIVMLVVALTACERRPNDPPKSVPLPKTQTAASTHVLDVFPAAHADAPSEIAWHAGDIESAFARARQDNKPVFFYYGAVWCPPCNQVKATILSRREFIERSRLFVPVYVDGDTRDGQRLAERFKVRGYPTMVLFKPDGSEITRLPGEVDFEQYLQVLALGLNATQPIKDTLTAALAGRPLAREDWRRLAYYAWEADEHQLVATGRLPVTLHKLANACPPVLTAARTRLGLKAIAAASAATPPAFSPAERKAAVARMLDVLSNPRLVRENVDVIAGAPEDIVRALSAVTAPERARLVAAWDRALRALVLDTTLSNTDRLAAMNARVSLALLDDPDARLTDAMIEDVRSEVVRADRESTNPYERQTVINAGAQVLTHAGLLDDSDQLLEAELERSPAPYYFMSSLAANAKKRGNAKRALEWYAKAYEQSRGPATRLQWGANWIGALIELAPNEERRIEDATVRVFGEFASATASIEGRNRAVLERLRGKLDAWNAKGDHAASLQRVKQRWAEVCAKLPADAQDRPRCERVMSTA